MLHNRKKQVNPISQITSFSNLALNHISEAHNITSNTLLILITMNTLQYEQNNFVRVMTIRNRLQLSLPLLYASIESLLSCGFIEIARKANKIKHSNLYNVTELGTTLIMSYNMHISRCLKDSKNSIWYAITKKGFDYTPKPKGGKQKAKRLKQSQQDNNNTTDI